MVEGKQLSHSVLLFDCFDKPESIKRSEWEIRGGNTQAQHIVKGSGKFLQNLENKAALGQFGTTYRTEKVQDYLPKGKSVVVAGGLSDGKKVVVINNLGTTEDKELASTNEEADTKIILHAITIAKKHSRLIIKCDDTDVMVLLTYYCGRGLLCEMGVIPLVPFSK